LDGWCEWLPEVFPKEFSAAFEPFFHVIPVIPKQKYSYGDIEFHTSAFPLFKDTVMAKKYFLRRLPGAIREQLVARSREYPLPTVKAHVEWLAEQGFKVSMSSVHRFLREQNAAKPSDAPEPAGDAEIRLGCLMVASGIAIPGDKVDLLKTAAELVEWVKR
jgi:hypothetical protein